MRDSCQEMKNLLKLIMLIMSVQVIFIHEHINGCEL